MLFSSTIFIYLFLPSVLLLYYTVLRKHRKAQNTFLFLASVFFYAWGEPKFVFVMLLSVLANWIFGLGVHLSSRPFWKKTILVLDIIFNLSMLFVFKYLNFTTSVLQKFIPSVAVTSIVLPIGISFFTFQAMSYVIDVYRGRGKVQKNILNVGLYITFFPQLIAGPIVRYETVAEEIQDRRENSEDFFGGFSRFVVGLSKKVLLSNTLAILADRCFELNSAGHISAGMAWLGATAYTLQIFFDFSGYSDMAIGLGKMFGFHFSENFNYPYISKSITEFWRRWHISLGTWFRDYVYFPLGGSRVKTKFRLALNLFVVWLLTGFWHGARWSFFLWGLMYFVLITFEKFTGLAKKEGRWINVLKRIYTLFFVVIGWVIFRAENLGEGFGYLCSMFSFTPGTDGLFLSYLSQNAVIILLGVLISTPVFKKLGQKLGGKPICEVARAVGLVLLFAFSVANLVSSAYNPFIYFNF